MLKTVVCAFLFLVASTSVYAACPPYTYTFTNGTTADATQVNANFTTVMSCASTNATILRGYISGLQLGAVGGTSSFSIATGVAADNAVSAYMELSSGYTKTTASWTVGSGNGGLDTGTIANSTWYHVYLIERTDTGITDILVSLSASAPTLPASYTLYRRIGSIQTDGSAHWQAFKQIGDEFIWTKSALDTFNSPYTVTTSSVLRTTGCPTGINVLVHLRGLYQDYGNAGQSAAAIRSPYETYSTASGSTAVVNPNGVQGVDVWEQTNTSAQVAVQGYTLGSYPYFYFYTVGWRDNRGKDLN